MSWEELLLWLIRGVGTGVLGILTYEYVLRPLCKVLKAAWARFHHAVKKCLSRCIDGMLTYPDGIVARIDKRMGEIEKKIGQPAPHSEMPDDMALGDFAPEETEEGCDA